MQLQGAWGQGCKRQRSKYGVKDTGQGGSQVPAPAPQENGLSAPRSNFSSKPPNLELYMNLLSSRMSCLPCEVAMSCTLPPSHLWVGTWSPLSYLPPETWCLGPFRYRALKSNQAGTGLKQEAQALGRLGGSSQDCGESCGLLSLWGYQTAPSPACLCVLALLPSAARLPPYKGEMAASGPTSLPASSQLPIPEGERRGPPLPGGKNHGKDPDWLSPGPTATMDQSPCVRSPPGFARLLRCFLGGGWGPLIDSSMRTSPRCWRGGHLEKTARPVMCAE